MSDPIHIRLIRLLGFLPVAMIAIGTTMHTAAADIQLKQGDRIVFLGDSITQAGARPDGYVTLVRDAINTAHPDLGVEVIGAGISGHKVPDCQERLERDVLDKQPTWVVIYIGINDVWHSTNNRGTSEKDFADGLKDMIDRIRAKDAKVVLCTASVIGEKTDGSNTLDEMLDRYCDISRKVAADNDVELLDLRKLFLEHLTKNNRENRPHSVLTTDGVHLNAAGNRFVADCMLTKLGVDPHAKRTGLLRHIVLFQFKDSASKDDIDRVVNAFADLKNKIDEIEDFEMGTNNSPEGLSRGLTHGFVVTFKTEEDRAAYLPHPEHKKFVELIGPFVDNVLVFDYWAK